MNEGLYRIGNRCSDTGLQRLHLIVRLSDAVILGHSHVAIDMDNLAILDDSEIMYINPLWLSIRLDMCYDFLVQFEIGFIHNAGYRSFYNT